MQVGAISEAFENFQLKTYGIKPQVHATPEKKKRRMWGNTLLALSSRQFILFAKKLQSQTIYDLFARSQIQIGVLLQSRRLFLKEVLHYICVCVCVLNLNTIEPFYSTVWVFA